MAVPNRQRYDHSSAGCNVVMTVGVAMLDRLLHRSVVFNIDGESYRMRAHRARADTLRKAAATRPNT